MKFTYIPDFGFKIDDHTTNRTIKWNDQREYIRKTVLRDLSYKKNDYNYRDLGLSQKRDIYETNDIFFFLNYDTSSNCLKEVEIHHGIDIEVNGVILKFGGNITEIVEQLGIQPKVLDDGGTYLFQSLKMTISNSQAMGKADGSDDDNDDDDGEDNNDDEGDDDDYEDVDDDGDNRLAYFYASSNINHLLEDD